MRADGRITIAGQTIRLGLRHCGKIVTVVVEDTHPRILYGEEQIAVRPRRSTKPITRFYVTGASVKPDKESSISYDKPSRISRDLTLTTQGRPRE